MEHDRPAPYRDRLVPPLTAIRPPRLAIALASLVLLGAGPAAHAEAPPTTVPGEVVVDVRGDGTTVPKVIKTDDVPGTIAALRKRDDVRYAVPNAVAHASELAPFLPNDPGRAAKAAGWRATQWYLDGPFSINAPPGWANLIAAKAPGARGVKIAILDSGVAYRAAPPRRASPELPRTRFLQGYDFVDDDAVATDEFGHGTIVAAIMAGETNNARGMAGIAYNARILPVRVLDRDGNGDATDIARGVRYAVKRGAKVINLSLEFPAEYTASDIPQLLDALSFARRRGVTTVVASGNGGLDSLPYPGRASTVIAVGATTEHGCVADYSNGGPGLNLVAPGGGSDGDFADLGCDPAGVAGRGITQLTLLGENAITLGYASRDGTSMASPQVAAAAAAIIASGVIGRKPTPAAVQRRLEQTARDLGPVGYDSRYGNGLVDLAAATAPRVRATPAP